MSSKISDSKSGLGVTKSETWFRKIQEISENLF